MCLNRLLEELFPFVYYLPRSRRQRRRCDSEDILGESAFANYEQLATEQLTLRLEEERERASNMDEKTFKLTLSLSVGLTVLGSIATFLVKAISFVTVQIVLTIIIGLGLFYILAAGVIALGALRTLPSYGYGTQFLMQKQQGNKQKVLAEALAKQETMNMVRHLRNETSYQALRNGLWLLFAGAMFFSVTLVYQSLWPTSCSLEEEPQFKSQTTSSLFSGCVGCHNVTTTS